MRLRGVWQSLQSAAGRLAPAGPREAMSHPSFDPARSGRAEPAGDCTGGARPRRRLTFTLGLITLVLSLCSGLATYLILTGLTPVVPTHRVVVGVLLINLMLVLAMIVIIAWQVTGLWLARHRQAAGAQLHVRIVSLFSVIAVVPAIVLAVFASISLNRGLDHWFSDRTKSIIQSSIDVATAYLQEHGQVIRADTVAMARDIDEAVELVKSQPQGFGNFLTAQAAIRALPMAYLIDGDGKILATAASLAEFPYKAPPQEAMELAKKGQVIVIAPGQTSLVGAIKGLQNFNDTYLYVVRPVNARVLQQLRATRASVAEYQLLEQRRAGVQVAFGMMYLAIALTLLLAAIWIGMWFANRLVAPIRQLMGAAQQISQGNLAVNVDVRPTDGDLAVLGSTFNTMTSELEESARRTGRREHEAGRPPPLHGGGVVGRDRRRGRCRRRRHHHSGQPFGRDLAPHEGGRSHRPAARQGGARVRRGAEAGPASRASVSSPIRSRSGARALSAISPCGSPPKARTRRRKVSS